MSPRLRCQNRRSCAAIDMELQVGNAKSFRISGSLTNNIGDDSRKDTRHTELDKTTENLRRRTSAVACESSPWRGTNACKCPSEARPLLHKEALMVVAASFPFRWSRRAMVAMVRFSLVVRVRDGVVLRPRLLPSRDGIVRSNAAQQAMVATVNASSCEPPSPMRRGLRVHRKAGQSTTARKPLIPQTVG
jgi:hypothetical protein